MVSLLSKTSHERPTFSSSAREPRKRHSHLNFGSFELSVSTASVCLVQPKVASTAPSLLAFARQVRTLPIGVVQINIAISKAPVGGQLLADEYDTRNPEAQRLSAALATYPRTSQSHSQPKAGLRKVQPDRTPSRRLLSPILRS